MLPPLTTWPNFADWLHSITPAGNSLFLSHIESAKLLHTKDSVWMWLVGEETQHKERIDRLAELLAQNGAIVLQELLPLEEEFLRMRLVTAREWIILLMVGGASPLGFPEMSLPDFVEWLLIEWWATHGSTQYAHELFLRSRK